MFTNLKYSSSLVVSICIAVGSMTISASAITAELAKKCEALTTKAFPRRVVGNPAAGSAKGTAQQVQSYYHKCLENGGTMDGQPPEDKTNDHGPNEQK